MRLSLVPTGGFLQMPGRHTGGGQRKAPWSGWVRRQEPGQVKLQGAAWQMCLVKRQVGLSSSDGALWECGGQTVRHFMRNQKSRIVHNFS